MYSGSSSLLEWATFKAFFLSGFVILKNQINNAIVSMMMIMTIFMERFLLSIYFSTCEETPNSG